MIGFNTIDVEMSDKSYNVQFNACKIISFGDNDLINVIYGVFKTTIYISVFPNKHKINTCDTKFLKFKLYYAILSRFVD